MDQVLGFLKNLDTFQYVLLAAGAFLLFPTVIKWWNAKPEDDVVDDVDHDDHKHETELSSLICKWECLCDSCHKRGLHGACEALQAVFPMLGKIYEGKHDVEKEGIDPE